MPEPKDPKPLNIKRQRFVKEIIAGSTQTEAVKAAGYNVSHDESAATIGTRLMKEPGVQNALRAAIDAEFPDVANRAAVRLNEMLNNPDTAPMIQLKAIEMLMKIYGWEAPKKSAHLRVDVDERFKLPE